MCQQRVATAGLGVTLSRESQGRGASWRRRGDTRGKGPGQKQAEHMQGGREKATMAWPQHRHPGPRGGQTGRVGGWWADSGQVILRPTGHSKGFRLCDTMELGEVWPGDYHDLTKILNDHLEYSVTSIKTSPEALAFKEYCSSWDMMVVNLGTMIMKRNVWILNIFQ